MLVEFYGAAWNVLNTVFSLQQYTLMVCDEEEAEN